MKHLKTIIILLTIFFSISPNLFGQSWNQIIKACASDRSASDNFGYSVSISGDYAIVGAYQEDENASGDNTLSAAGSAYIFVRDGNSWTQQQKIVASDRSESDNFGYSVSISGDYAIVGAYQEDENASGDNTLSAAGSAYIFVRDGNSWTQQQKIVANDRGTSDYFGRSVSISGDYAITGAINESQDASGLNYLNAAGSAYIFVRSGTSWTQQQKIVANDRGAGDYFGNSVSISGDYVIVGAYQEDEDASGVNTIGGTGSAYIFVRSGESWAQQQKIVANDRGENDCFGNSVSISGDYAIVCAEYEDEDASGENTRSNAGSAYIFVRSGTSWTQQQKIVANDRGSSDYFGNSVSISGTNAIVGAFSEDQDASGTNTMSGAGSAYIFGFSAPTAQATDLLTSINSSNQIVLSYTASDDAESYLVVRATGSAPTFTPVDGTEYTTGSQIGGEIIYVGTAVTATDDISSDGTYYYAVYAYNGSGTSTKYLTTNPLSGSVNYDTDGTNTIDNTSDPVSASFPDQDVTVNFTNGCNGTELTVSKNSSVPASNFAALPGVKGVKSLFFSITSTNANPGTYTIVLDFSSLGLTETQWNNFKIMKRANSSSKFQDVTTLGGTIESRCTDGTWGKFTISGLSSFSEFAGGEAATTYTVTSSADDVDTEGTLKYYITNAVADDIIEFNTTSMGGNTITLGSAIEITKDLTIRGASGGIIIDGDDSYRILEIGDGVTLRLENLKLQNGYGGDGQGGAVYNQGSLTMINCVVSGNSDDMGSSGSGGIYQDNDSNNELNLVNCTITNNSCEDLAETGTGGLVADAGTVNIYNTIIYGNTGDGYGDINEGNTVTELQNSCVRNYASLTITTDGGDNISNDPDFVGTSNSTTHPYSISGSSPCLDIGDDSYCFEDYDIKGSGRKLLKTDGSTTGTIDIGAYEYDSATPLPVELVSFTASIVEEGVRLNWETATEVNNYGFEVQRRVSSNEYGEVGTENLPSEWSIIGFVEGSGNSNSPKKYEFTDSDCPSGNLKYRLKQIDTDGNYEYYSTTAKVDIQITDVEESSIPTEFGLDQNYPNPFNPSTVISYQLSEISKVQLKVFDMLGREVATLVNKEQAAGYYSVNFDASKLSTGIYIYRLIAENFVDTKKMILIK